MAASTGALSDEQVSTLAAAIVDSVKATASGTSHQPRTSWDALTEIVGKLFDLLGKSAVYLLALALLGVGWYFLEEQQNKKDEFAKKQLELLEKQRNNAFELVQKSYKEITDVAAKQILNLDSSMALLKTISDEVDQNQKQVFDQRLNAYKTEKELERTREEVLEADAKIRKGQEALDRAKAEATESQREKEDAIRKSEKELDEEKKKLDGKERALNRRAGTIGDLQDALRQLAKATEEDMEKLEVRTREVYEELGLAERQLRDELMDEPWSDPDLEGLAQKLTEALEKMSAASVKVLALSEPDQYKAMKLSEGPILDFIIDPAMILAPFGDLSQPIFDGSKLDGLVGVSLQKVMEQIQQGKGFGFDYWVTFTDDSLGSRVLFGAVQDEAGLFAAVVLSSEEAEHQYSGDGDRENTEGARIVETEYARGIVPAYVPDADNWMSTGVLLVLFDEDGEIDSDFTSDWKANPDGTLSFQYLFDTAVVQLVWGKSNAFQPLTYEQLNRATVDNRLPHRVLESLRDPAESPRVNFEMIERAKNADAVLSGARLDRIGDKELRDLFEEMVRKAIERDVAAVERLTDIEYLDPAEVAGMLASVALRPEFRVEEYHLERRQPIDSAPEESQLGMSPASTEPESGWTQTATITLSAMSGAGFYGDRVSMTFERSSSRREWRLTTYDEG